jgi:two-component system cell cycle sensor histidine kinase/response regulator CckA
MDAPTLSLDEAVRSFADAIPAMIWITDPGGSCSFANSAWLALRGRTLEQEKGQGWIEGVQEDDRALVRARYQDAFEAKQNFELSMRLFRPGVGYRPLRLSCSAWFPGGVFRGFVCFIVDGIPGKSVPPQTSSDALRTSARCAQNSLEIIAWTLDPRSMRHQSNPPFHDYVGMPVEATQGFGWADAVHPEDQADAVEHVRNAIAQQSPISYDARFRRADGHYCSIAVRGLPLHDDAGRLLHWTGIFSDITEQKNSIALLQAVADNALDGIVGIDADGIIESFNLAAEKQFGYSQEEVVGKNVKILMPEPFHSEHDAYLANYLQTGVAKIIGIGRQVIARRKDGSTFPIELGVSEFYLDGKRHFTGVIRDITTQVRREQSLRLMDRAMRAVSQGILITDPTVPDNPIVYASQSFENLTGYRTDEVLGRNCRFLQGPGTDRSAVARLRSAIAKQEDCVVELLNYRKDGSTFWNALAVSPVRDDQGRLANFVGVQVDVSERHALEAQVRQAQKMEAVGQLAGGVAHDFNNLLTIISGYSEILMQLLPPDDMKRQAVTAISDAGNRAAGLTRQLLAFSRQTVLEPKVLDLNSVVVDTEKMLRRVIGEDVALSTSLEPNLSRVRVDPGQIGQILLNLAVNARDAMPQGGRLTIETKNVTVDENYVSTHLEAEKGRYVLIAVSDTGIGMTEQVRSRIFEPFFTTKGIGKGTGLGLSVVHGIVKQSKGHIEVYSEVGIGTTFKIYLPAVQGSLSHWRLNEPNGSPGGAETILLVEDEDGVREIAKLILQTHGYTVLVAANGEEALRRAADRGDRIDLLLTDVVMPGMSGRQVAEILKGRNPAIKVLFLSGYTDDAIVRHGILQAEVAFLQKPYTPAGLLRKVRQVLDEPSPPKQTG